MRTRFSLRVVGVVGEAQPLKNFVIPLSHRDKLHTTDYPIQCYGTIVLQCYGTMALSYQDPWRTMIIPVTKEGNQYSISVTKEIWNDLQVLILNGAKGERLTLEFDIKK